MGGDQDITGGWKSGETTPHERYFPWYYFRARPVITSSPASVTHGGAFTVNTPSATSIAKVLLIRPGAATHGFNQSHRLIGCEIIGRGPTSLQVKAPPHGNIAPPGYYLLFIVDTAWVPESSKVTVAGNGRKLAIATKHWTAACTRVPPLPCMGWISVAMRTGTGFAHDWLGL